MSKHFIFLFSILLFVGCQKNEVPQETIGGDAGSSVVQSADGTTYSIACLRENSTSIQRQGSSAMSRCAVDLEDASSMATSERGKFFNTSYAYVYNPTTYCPPSYYTTTYSPSYNPYYDTSYSSNPFCSYVFGSGSSVNCYYALGYNSNNTTYYNPSYYSSYSSNYNSSCTACLYSNRPANCLKRCFVAKYLY